MDRPLFAAPYGYVVDFEDPQRTGQAANLYAGCIGMILATLCLGVKIYPKLFLAKKFSTDDGASLIAWGFAVAVHVIILLQFSRGTLGVHIWEVPAYKIESTFELIRICAILYCAFSAAAKFSLLLLYLRLSRLRWFRMGVFATMFLVVGSNIALVFPLMFTCTPVSRTDKFCLNPAPIHTASSALDVATNIILLALPVPIILKWKPSRLEKIGLAFAFTIGTATCITSIIRLAATYPEVRSTDPTWTLATPTLWALIEANLLLVVTSTLPLSLHHLFPTLTNPPVLQPTPASPGTHTHTTPSYLPAIELTPTHSTFKDGKRYSRMTASSASISISISSAELPSWTSQVASRTSVVTMPAPVLDRRLSSRSVGTIVQTRTTTVTSELVAGLGDGAERRGSWTSPF